MPDRHPVTDDARARLRVAQDAESQALREVAAAEKARHRIKLRLDEAEARRDAAVVALVATSGLERAARLLDEPVRLLRRLAHRHDADRGDRD